jgi:small subunit ribosomal protein S4
MKLFLKGERCYKEKCAIERRNAPPGQHGMGRRRKVRAYGLQLREKQKLRRIYGLLEGQFRFATSRTQARQLVRHGHISVDGRRVNIPSFRVRPGMEIGVREKSRKNTHISEAVEFAQGRGIPPWLELDADTFTGKVLENPVREDIRFPIQEQLIVELYSR